ncbi:MAG: DUF6691 family protein [Pseudomonadota bacterium]
MKHLLTLLAGALFGIGIAISGMANPAKVVNFFDIAGSWDPSLIFVMGGALLTTIIGYRIVFGIQAAPLFEPKFYLPARRDIDPQLVGGSALFGVGWGISGFCSGGALPALGLGHWEVPVFVASMSVGIIIARTILHGRSSVAPA